MKFPMPREYKYIREVDSVWYGEPHYKKNLIVPEISVKYGSLASKVKTMPSYANYLVGSLVELSKAVKSIQSNPYIGKNFITETERLELMDFIKNQGISDVGFIQLKESHMFTDSIALFKYAMVFIMEMNHSEIAYAPSKRTNKEVFRTYYELGKSVNAISDFLRSKGYNAQPIPAISSNLNLSVMARDSGIGEFGKNGLIITRAFGPSVRIAAVLTDIENLPTTEVVKNNWIKDFCDKCNACVRKCPAQAIYQEPIIFEDGSESHIDYKKCAVPFTKQYGCTMCIKECTFFKSNYEKIRSAAMQSEIL